LQPAGRVHLSHSKDPGSPLKHSLAQLFMIQMESLVRQIRQVGENSINELASATQVKSEVGSVSF
jgi:hypothetical protein